MKPEVLFACIASILVQVYAPYAKHSGIPEIKSILGGLVISNFMSAWTLLIKSLGLVSTLMIPLPLQATLCDSLTSVSLLRPVYGWAKKDPWYMLLAVVRSW